VRSNCGVRAGTDALDDTGCGRRDCPECMDVGHDIVPALLLLLRSHIKLLGRQVLEHEHGPRQRPRSSVRGGRGRTRFASICAIASSEMFSPSSFSAIARFSQSLRQVWKRICPRAQLALDLSRAMGRTHGGREEVRHLLARIAAARARERTAGPVVGDRGTSRAASGTFRTPPCWQAEGAWGRRSGNWES
jgi:hypothetical protein